jgi:hypothetical protein
MPLMPFGILGSWLRGLLSLAIPILAVFCLKWWYDESWVVERTEVVRVEEKPPGVVKTTVREQRIPEPAADDRGAAAPAVDPSAAGRREFRFEPGWNRATAELAAAVALLAWAVAGRWIGRGLTSLVLRPGQTARGECRRRPRLVAIAGEGGGDGSSLAVGRGPDRRRGAAARGAPGPSDRQGLPHPPAGR